MFGTIDPLEESPLDGVGEPGLADLLEQGEEPPHTPLPGVGR